MTGTTDWRDGPFLSPDEPVDLTNCAAEPIHLVPSVQPSGWLFVAGDDDLVLACSDDAGDLLGVAAAPRGRPLADVLGSTAAELLGASRLAPLPMLVGGRAVEVRAHRSRSGVAVVEVVRVDRPAAGATPLHVRMVHAIEHLRGASGVVDLAQRAATVVREVLGYDRVWIYRFDPEWHGEVIAEDAADGVQPFLGLHFDQGDIPAQARALFLENRVRIIRDAAPSRRLVPERLADGTWVDLSDATLRGVSPMHLTYLAHLGVQASASLAIVVDGVLWGLCSAHHYAGPRYVDFETESAAALLAEFLSMQVAALERAARAGEQEEVRRRAGDVLTAVAGSTSVIDGVVAAADALLALARASGAAVRIAGRIRTVGDVPGRDALDQLFRVLDDRLETSDEDTLAWVRAADEVLALDSDTRAAGVLALVLSREAGNWIVWFRPELVSTITWGDPMATDAPDAAPDEVLQLTPAASMAIFRRTMRGRSAPWTTADLEAARHLRSSLGALVFQRAEQLARSVDALRAANAELDRFAYVAAHDLKEPIRGIHNYADVLREETGPLTSDGEHALGSIQRLTDRMSALVQSLLDYATVGRGAFRVSRNRLADLLDDATEMLHRLITDRGARIRLLADVELEGDRIQLVQVLTNLIANAIKYTPTDRQPDIELEPVDLGATGRGWAGWPHHNADVPPPVVVAVRDQGIGVAPADRERIFEVFQRLHGRDEYGGGSGAGLAIARRIAERHGGALWVEPNEPQGSVFYLAVSAPHGHLPVTVAAP